MSISVNIPTPLRKLTQDQAVVEVTGATVGGVIDGLERDFPGMGERLCDGNGNILRFVNIFLNEEDVRFLNGRDTPVTHGDQISIVQAIAGG